MRALLIVLTLTALGIVVYSHSIDFDATDESVAVAPMPRAGDSAIAAAATIAQTSSNVVSNFSLAEESISAPYIDLSNNNLSDDPRERAVVIDALAAAPESQAVPLLQKVLTGGVESERQLALNSLRRLALNQGDAGGRIRDILRLVIYDGEDGIVTAGAQAALDDIEYNIEPVSMN